MRGVVGGLIESSSSKRTPLLFDAWCAHERMNVMFNANPPPARHVKCISPVTILNESIPHSRVINCYLNMFPLLPCLATNAVFLLPPAHKLTPPIQYETSEPHAQLRRINLTFTFVTAIAIADAAPVILNSRAEINVQYERQGWLCFGEGRPCPIRRFFKHVYAGTLFKLKEAAKANT